MRFISPQHGQLMIGKQTRTDALDTRRIAAMLLGAALLEGRGVRLI